MAELVQGLVTVRRLADELDVGMIGDQRTYPIPQHGVVVYR